MFHCPLVFGLPIGILHSESETRISKGPKNYSHESTDSQASELFITRGQRNKAKGHFFTAFGDSVTLGIEFIKFSSSVQFTLDFLLIGNRVFRVFQFDRKIPFWILQICSISIFSIKFLKVFYVQHQKVDLVWRFLEPILPGTRFNLYCLVSISNRSTTATTKVTPNLIIEYGR